MTSPDRFLTTGDVARLFEVNPETVRRWVAKGLLAEAVFLLPSGQLRFYRDRLPDIAPAEDVATAARESA